MTGTTALAHFAAQLEWEKVPPHRQQTLRVAFGNTAALIVGSSRSVAVRHLVEAFSDTCTEPRARLLGQSEEVPPVWGALIQGFAAHYEDFDDTHLDSVVHPGPPVIPAALAAAEMVNAAGQDVLAGVAAGMEGALQVGNLIPQALDRGWHMTGVAGQVGAAAAAAQVLRLTSVETEHAIAIAATQTAGLTEALGTMTKPLHPGKAAANGLEAALLAAAGMTGPAHAIEGPGGLLAAMGAQSSMPTLRYAGDWLLDDNVIKPYACGVLGHSVIDLALLLREKVQDRAQLESVTLRVHPLVLTAMGRQQPRDGLESKFSVMHSFAVGLLDGYAGPEQFDDTRANDPVVEQVRAQVTAVPDPALARYEVHMRALLADGGSVEAQQMTPAKLTFEGAMAKALRLVAPVLREGARDFVETIFAPDSLDSLDQIYDRSRQVTPTG